MTQCASTGGVCLIFETTYHHDAIIVTEISQILKLQPLLVDLCARCDQENGWDDLKYFFSLPFARNKTPLLLLFADRDSLTVDTLSASSLVAAVLTYEYRVWGWGTRVYLTDDYSGRRSVIAPAPIRTEVVQSASRVLFERGAAVSVMSYQVNEDCPDMPPAQASMNLQWASQQRDIFSYLPLKGTFEATMATLGKRTRSHMRYYRRQSERDLGCNYVDTVHISREDFLQLNRECSFATTDDLAMIRYDSLANSPYTFLSGIRDKEGRWLSLVGGYEKDDMIEIYWQMNLASQPDYSLSTVMRSFLMEAAIGRGIKKLFIEGGTPHPMRFSFVRQDIRDFIVKRTGVYAALVRLVASSRPLKKNFLARLLLDKELAWHRW